MKATGIVRRVDDLGRIVIPKEIRRTLRIREGDPLEIYTEKDGGVIFRKYSPMGDLQDFASQMCEAIGSSTGKIAAVADRDAIYQILYNICDNAVKFSREKGTYRISIRYAGEDGQETKHDAKMKKILVSVYNQGQGIAPEDLPYVFERFYKADKSRGLDRSGVGLGMFISKTIIDAHGEKIWVESQHHEWCNFFFTLPRDMQLLPKASQSASIPNKNNS